MTPGFHTTPEPNLARKSMTLGRTPPSDWRQQFLAHLQNKMSGQKSTPPPAPVPKLKSSPSVESFFPKAGKAGVGGGMLPGRVGPGPDMPYDPHLPGAWPPGGHHPLPQAYLPSGYQVHLPPTRSHTPPPPGTGTNLMRMSAVEIPLNPHQQQQPHHHHHHHHQPDLIPHHHLAGAGMAASLAPAHPPPYHHPLAAAHHVMAGLPPGSHPFGAPPDLTLAYPHHHLPPPHGDGTKTLYASMKPHPHPGVAAPAGFLHPALDFAAPHGYGTLPPGALASVVGVPAGLPGAPGRGPPTLLDRSHARMIPQPLPPSLHPGSRTVDSSFLLQGFAADPGTDPAWAHAAAAAAPTAVYPPSQISGSTDSGYAHSHHVYDPHGTGTGTPMIAPPPGPHPHHHHAPLDVSGARIPRLGTQSLYNPAAFPRDGASTPGSRPSRSSTPVSTPGLPSMMTPHGGSPMTQKRLSYPPTSAAAAGGFDAAYSAVAAAGAGTGEPHHHHHHHHGPNKYQLFNVMIKKNPGLGFSIAGGVGSLGNPFRPNDPGIFVTKIQPGGPADNILRPGDKIVEVNGKNFSQVQHEEAVTSLKSCGPQVSLLIERDRHSA